MNVKFVIRGFLIALPTALIILGVGLNLMIAQMPIGQPPDPPPLPRSSLSNAASYLQAQVGWRSECGIEMEMVYPDPTRHLAPGGQSREGVA